MSEQNEDLEGSSSEGPIKAAGIKPTRDELDKRIELVAGMLVRRMKFSQIKRAIIAKYKVCWRTVAAYVARARKLLIARTRKPKDWHFSNALALYESVITDPESTKQEKMTAQGRIDALFGLEAPKKHQHGGDPDAAPIRVAQATFDLTGATLEQLEALERLLESVEQHHVLTHDPGQAPALPADSPAAAG